MRRLFLRVMMFVAVLGYYDNEWIGIRRAWDIARMIKRRKADGREASGCE